MDEKQFRVLLIDDDEDEFVMLRDLLSEGRSASLHLDWVATYEEGFAALTENGYDAYLLDYRLGDRDGVKLLREVTAAECDAVIIMLTGLEDNEVDIEAMRCGCADYLVKRHVDRDILERSIRHSIERKHAERDLRRTNEALKAEISERKRIEEALRLDEMRLEALWELSRMSGGPDEEITDFVLDQLIKITGSKCGSLRIVREDETVFTIEGPGEVFKECPELAWFFAPEVEREIDAGNVGIPKPVIINDYQDTGPIGKCPGCRVSHRIMSVPVLDEGRAAAVATMADKETDYDESDVRQVRLLLDGMWRHIQRHRAEKALREAENSLRLMADSLPALVSYIDSNQRYRFVNRTHDRYGISSEQIVGLRMDEVLSPQDYELVRPHVEKALEGHHVQFEIESDFDQTKVFLSVWYIPNLDETGGVVGFFALTHDLTERKRNEMEAQRHRDELAHVARVATMGELSSSLAHELGQPLTGILGNTQAALRFLDRAEPDLEEVKSALDDIVDDCKRAGNVIRKLRSILKKKDFEKIAVDVNALVKETLKLVASEAVKKRVAVEADLCPSMPNVMGDKIQLQQVLVNLILNGFDAMARFEGNARRMIVRTLADPDTVTVEVSDSGPGVDPQNMSCIFDPFFTTKIEGIGMGLPISRYILDTHKGRLWAERNPECGMTFSFALPALKQLQPMQDPADRSLH